MNLPTRALIDACVLYSAQIRDLLIRLAICGVHKPCWTAKIHEEWIRNLLGNRLVLTRTRLERTKSMMDEAVSECLVTDYEHHIDTLTLPDLNDRHVLAAAIQAGATVIFTFNLSDFPDEALASHSIIAQHPDDFLCELFDSAIDDFCGAAHLQRRALANPPKSAEEFLDTLAKAGIPLTSARLRSLVHRI